MTHACLVDALAVWALPKAVGWAAGDDRAQGRAGGEGPAAPVTGHEGFAQTFF